MRLLFLLLFSAFTSAHLFAQTPAAPPPTVATFRPGDVFEMKLSGVPEDLGRDFQGGYTVSQDGNVNIPLIHEIRVIGLTPPQVEKLIQSKLVAEKFFTNPGVNINTSPNSRFVVIGGGVRAPQRLAWSPDLTLRSAVELAGGLTDWGSWKGIRLIRDGKPTVYDARKFDRDPAQDPKLLPGDQVIVPQ
jgi:polysaccharide export outer membrane protein